MKNELAKVAQVFKADDWREMGPQVLNEAFAWSYFPQRGLDVDASREKLKAAIEFNEEPFSYSGLNNVLFLAAANAEALERIFQGVIASAITAKERGEDLRQVSLSHIVSFRAEQESFVWLLVESYREYVMLGVSEAVVARASGALLCSQSLLQGVISLLSYLELNEPVSLYQAGFRQINGLLCNILTLNREFTENAAQPRESVEAIAAHLGLT